MLDLEPGAGEHKVLATSHPFNHSSQLFAASARTRGGVGVCLLAEE